MSFLDVLQACKHSGIKLVAKEGRLLVAETAGKITPELRAGLGAHKAEILAWLGGEQAAAPSLIRAQPARARYPLSFSQQRLWFIDQLEGGSPEYNIPMAFGLSGELNQAALQQALDGIVARHAVLRTVFNLHDDEPMQVVQPPQPVSITHTDLGDLPDEAQKQHVQQMTE